MRKLALLILTAAVFADVRQAAAQFPFPGRRTTPRTPSSTTSQRKETAPDNPLVKGLGTVRSIDDKMIVVEAEDSRILECALNAQTTFRGPEGSVTRDDVRVGARVRIESKADDDGNLTATSIALESEAEKPVNEKTATIQKTAPASDDEDAPPVLRRGAPPKRRQADIEPSEDIAAAAPPEKEERPALQRRDGNPTLLDKARETSLEFTDHLPNFVCQQFTTRYEMDSKATGWRPMDVVSADVLFMDGKEQYQNIKIGNRKVSLAMMDIKGQRSEGEYGSTLKGLFDHATAADFTPTGDSRVGARTAKMYSFSVARERSDWRVLVGGQSIVPAYSGRIWVDRESGRVLRMERQARNIPEEFPMDSIEMTVDYDFTTLGTRRVLLPAQSENLSCQRSTPYCHKNSIQFRNYREFRGEANITFDADKP